MRSDRKRSMDLWTSEPNFFVTVVPVDPIVYQFQRNCVLASTRIAVTWLSTVQ
jgi:hypothetical protein